MYTHELSRYAAPVWQQHDPATPLVYQPNALATYGGLAGYASDTPARMLYDGLGNPVGILPFVAALAPILAKAATALPAIMGKVATVLPKITSAASTIAPMLQNIAPPTQTSTPTLAPQPFQPVLPQMAPLQNLPLIPQPPSDLLVNTPMRTASGETVMVRRRIMRRRRRSTARMINSPLLMPKQQSRPLPPPMPTATAAALNGWTRRY